MPRTSAARSHHFVCPLCGERLAKDDEGRGYVRHLEPPRGSQIFEDTAKINRMLEAGDLDHDYIDYFNETGRCPYQQGQRDLVSHESGTSTVTIP